MKYFGLLLMCIIYLITYAVKLDLMYLILSLFCLSYVKVEQLSDKIEELKNEK